MAYIEGDPKDHLVQPLLLPSHEQSHQPPVKGAQDSILSVHRIMESSFYQDSFSPVKCTVQGLRVYFELFKMSVKLNPQGQPQSEFERYPGGISIFTSKFIFLVITLAFGELAIKWPDINIYLPGWFCILFAQHKCQQSLTRDT